MFFVTTPETPDKFDTTAPAARLRQSCKTALLACALTATLSAAADEDEVDVTLQQVSEHVYYAQGAPRVATDNQGFVSNAGVIVTDDGVVVFDALGTPALSEKLLASITQLTDLPVVKVVVSHYHADHVYGLQTFDDRNVEILAPVGARDYLASDVAAARLEERRISLYPWVDDDTRLVAPTRILDSAEQFTLGEVTFTIDIVGAAHSDGDLTLLVEPDRVLFSGDIIFEERLPFVGNADTKHWLQRLERMETNGIAVLVPGHGPANHDAIDSIRLTRRYLAFLREKMSEAVEELETFDEAYQRIDWSEFQSLPTFEEGNRGNAYGVYLSLERELLAE